MNTENRNYLRCIEALKDAPSLNNLSSAELRPLLEGMAMEQWPEKTFKNSQDSKYTVYFVLSGRLKVYQINPNSGRQHTIMLLSKGDIFDVLRLVDSEQHEVYWEAIDDMELLSVPVTYMRSWTREFPSANYSIMSYLAKRMRLLEETATERTLHGTLIRLSRLLLRNTNTVSQRLELINNLADDEIASMIGTTRAVVNRHLQELKKEGAITVSRKHINVQDINKLTYLSRERYSA